MAISNMVVTVVANTTKFSSGMRKAAQQTTSFGAFAKRGFGIAAGAVVGLGIAMVKLVPEFLNLGLEARKAEVRLTYMARNMSGLGKATDKTVQRLMGYADATAYATGVDDEQIMAIQAKLLMFKNLAKTAGSVGGMFDRVTKAAINLGAVGFGTAETNAVKLARMMQDPIKNINVLNRLGVVFTDAEKRKATAIEKTNGKMAASDYLMKIIEGKVNGLAEKTADPLAVIGIAFQNIGEEIAKRALPMVDNLKQQIIDWIQSPGGKKAIQDIADQFGKFVTWLGSTQGKKDIKAWLDNAIKIGEALVTVANAVLWLSGAGSNKMKNFTNSMDFSGNGSGSGSGSGPIWSQGTGGSQKKTSGGGGLPPVADRQGASIVVNINGPIDSVSSGREVQRVLDSYHRANGGR
jgi:hypothetical protein